jgi:hypothetical protein
MPEGKGWAESQLNRSFPKKKKKTEKKSNKTKGIAQNSSHIHLSLLESLHWLRELELPDQHDPEL